MLLWLTDDRVANILSAMSGGDRGPLRPVSGLPRNDFGAVTSFPCDPLGCVSGIDSRAFRVVAGILHILPCGLRVSGSRTQPNRQTYGHQDLFYGLNLHSSFLQPERSGRYSIDSEKHLRDALLRRNRLHP